jgi:ABC-type polysaccharide/polyol phosphate export permease
VYGFFRDATTGGMMAIESNAGIITKVRVPKYLFVLSKNITAMINMALTLILLLIFCLAYRAPLTWKYLLALYPLLCLTLFNIGAGLLLSGIYVFFRDTRYFYDIFCTVVMYFSAIFYTTTAFPAPTAWLFNLNPIFCYISFVRKLIINGESPSARHWALCLFYAAAALGVGCWMYLKNNKKYVYSL